jgi:site-specific DNA-cytosine methylase
MNIFSPFDGCACARAAVDKMGISCTYYASEVDKWAIQIANKNYPDIIQLGNIQDIKGSNLPEIDLMIGGSPCQDLSNAGNGAGLKGSRSALFYDFVRLLEEIKPKYFVLENVASMKKIWRDKITEILGVEPILIDSALVSAQQRKRLYWTNIEGVTQPDDKGIVLKDIIESGVVDRNKAYAVDANYWKGTTLQQYKNKNRRQIVHSSVENNKFRILTPVECERLQTLPDNYTEGVSNTQRYRMLGNGFTVDVIAHILSYME